jgi:glycosyltransferase involved in cell wall biosynthesis
MHIHLWRVPSPDVGGGGGHFLRDLNAVWASGIRTDTPADADAVLVNSYQDLLSGVQYKVRHADIAFVLRLGPIFRYHRPAAWRSVDDLLVLVANTIADAVIFQSRWAREQARQLGFSGSVPHAVIHNGVDDTIFTRRPPQALGKKIRLVATSWSTNDNKGFTSYATLEDRIDWSRYDMTFAGRSPFPFRRITMIPPQPPAALSRLLQQHDVYLGLMRHEACSNALLEALACGLPTVALDSGANAELVDDAGVLVHSVNDVLPALDRLVGGYETYQSYASAPRIADVAQQYRNFIASAQPRRTRWELSRAYGKILTEYAIFRTRERLEKWRR